MVRGRGAGERHPGKVSRVGNCFAVKLKIFDRVAACDALRGETKPESELERSPLTAAYPERSGRTPARAESSGVALQWLIY